MIDVIACPNCQRMLNLPPECEGQEVQCPGCKTQFRAVPQAPPVSPLAVTTPAFPAPPAVTVREEEIDPGTLPPPSTPRGRPRPLLRNAPRPSRSSGAKAVWMVPVGGVIVMTCLCGIFRSLDRGHHQVAIPPHVVVKQDDPKDWPGNPVGPIPFGARNDGPGFIVGLNPQLNAQMARDLAPLFKGLGDTLAAHDQQRIASYLNPQRMVEEAIAQGMLADNPAVNRQDLGQRMADDLAKALQEPATLLPWNSSEVKHAASVGPSEAVVIVRHRNADGGVVTMRWWVTNRTGVWCVYDQEELNLGIRYTVTAPAVLAVGDNPGVVRRAAAQVRDARLAIAQRHDADSAEKLLAQTAGVALPQPLEVLRLITRISIELHQGRAQAALLTIDQWHALHLDTPLIGLFRGIAFNMLNQRDQALAHLRPYQQLVGDDALVCKELGDALRGLHRMQEAQKEYRTSLDCDPKNGAAFKGLVQALLPGDPREDLGRRFAKLDKPAETFEFLCENRRLTRDADSLEMLALAMRKIDPNCSAASYGLSLAKAWQGQGGEAVKAYQAALALEKDADKRRSFTTHFLMAMASCGLAHAAYPVAPDKRDAFGTLAGELKKFYRLDDMAPLVALHTKDDPADPLLPFYQAEVYVRRGQYEKADEAFGLGLADPPGLPLLDTFRDSRVLARYHVGKAMAAYNTIGPKEDTFRQLAAICLQDGKFDLLTELLDAHAKTHPDLPDLLLYRCRMKVRQNAVAEAITLFKAGVAKVADERNRRQLVADFLLDMAQEGKAVEAYEAAPRASEAFDPLAYELRDLGRMDDLRRLLTAHGKAHPEDYRLSLHRGHLLLQEQKWPEAARELSEAWRRAPADQRIAVRFDYVEALYRMGRAREAYNTIEPRGEVFRQLAQTMVVEKKGADLQTLLDVHRFNAVGDPIVIHYEAYAKLLNKDFGPALTLWSQAWQKQSDPIQKQQYVRDIALAVYNAGRGLDGYRAAPDKQVAFEALASHLVAKKKPDELLMLLTEHGKQHANNPWRTFYAGELALLRGDVAEAEQCFAGALDGASSTQRWQFRRGLQRAQIAAGKSAIAYHDAGGYTRAFEELAQLCADAKNPKQLSALIAEHRKNDPDDPVLLGWEIEASWLSGDYAKTLDEITKHQGELKRQPRFGDKFDGYLIRCLVKLNRAADAVREADAWAKAQRFRGGLFQVLAHAAAGDVKEAIDLASQSGANRFTLEVWYADPDLGPLLRGDAMKAFRQRFPDPKRDL